MSFRVCWFDEMGLHGNKKAKVKAFNRKGLIKPLGSNFYLLKALPGNKQDHTVFNDGLTISCTCQNFQISGDHECSHIMAVAYYEHIKGGITE